MLAAMVVAVLSLTEVSMNTQMLEDQTCEETHLVDVRGFDEPDEEDEEQATPDSLDFEPIEVRCAEEDPAKQVTD
ncbi:hypothetical protein [Chondromyces apiculatus]|nr:hypothetical protein [Chondromyces apiculatus]